VLARNDGLTDHLHVCTIDPLQNSHRLQRLSATLNAIAARNMASNPPFRKHQSHSG
jgi:hypothetical protein